MMELYENSAHLNFNVNLDDVIMFNGSDSSDNAANNNNNNNENNPMKQRSQANARERFRTHRFVMLICDFCVK